MKAALYSSFDRAKMGLVGPKVGVVANFTHAYFAHNFMFSPPNFQYLPTPIYASVSHPHCSMLGSSHTYRLVQPLCLLKNFHWFKFSLGMIIVLPCDSKIYRCTDIQRE